MRESIEKKKGKRSHTFEISPGSDRKKNELEEILKGRDQMRTVSSRKNGAQGACGKVQITDLR